jgi:hypothetical protein
MTHQWPDNKLDGLNTPPSSDPFDDFYNDEYCTSNGAELDDDVDETFYREDDFDIDDLL